MDSSIVMTQEPDDGMEIDARVYAQRGSKRGAREEEEGDADEVNKRSKVEREINYDQDDYTEDQSPPPPSSSKRTDRSSPLSLTSFEQERTEKRSRSGARSKSGSKRERDEILSDDDEDFEEEDRKRTRNADSEPESGEEETEDESPALHSTKPKRARSMADRQQADMDDEDAMDGSFEDLEKKQAPVVDDPVPSRASRSKKSSTASSSSKIPSKIKRKIGEEWRNADGDRFKLDPQGVERKLSEVLELRKKYKMPSDSQHPDKDVVHEVVVEKWLSNEEYDAALKDRKLAWQSKVPEPVVEEVVDADMPPAQDMVRASLFICVTSASSRPRTIFSQLHARKRRVFTTRLELGHLCALMRRCLVPTLTLLQHSRRERSWFPLQANHRLCWRVVPCRMAD